MQNKKAFFFSFSCLVIFFFLFGITTISIRGCVKRNSVDTTRIEFIETGLTNVCTGIESIEELSNSITEQNQSTSNFIESSIRDSEYITTTASSITESITRSEESINSAQGRIDSIEERLFKLELSIRKDIKNKTNMEEHGNN